MKRLLFLIFLSFCLPAQAVLPDMHLSYSQGMYNNLRASGFAAGLFRTIAELNSLKSENTFVKEEKRIARVERGLELLVKEGKRVPYRYQKALEKSKTKHGQTYKDMVDSERVADALGGVEEVVAVRNNIAEKIVGAGSQAIGFSARKKSFIGRFIPLRYVLVLLDGVLGMTRQVWNRSPEQVKWITAAQSSARFLKMLLRHGVKDINKRVWVAYLLQLVRVGLSFVGDPRENKKAGMDMHGHLTDEQGNRLYSNDRSPNFAAIAQAHQDRTHQHFGYYDDPTHSTSRRSTADRERNRAQREILFTEHGNLRRETGAIPENFNHEGRIFYDALIYDPSRIEPNWEQWQARAVAAGEGQVVAERLIARHKKLWEERRVISRYSASYGTTDYYFDDGGYLCAPGRGRLRSLDGSHLIWPDKEVEYKALTASGNTNWEEVRRWAKEVLRPEVEQQILARIAEYEQRWDADHAERERMLAEQRFTQEGVLINGYRRPHPFIVVGGRAFYTPLSPGEGRSEPNWEELSIWDSPQVLAMIARHRALWDSRQTVTEDMQVPPGVGEYYFDDDGVLRNAQGIEVRINTLDATTNWQQMYDLMNASGLSADQQETARQFLRGARARAERSAVQQYAREKGLSYYLDSTGYMYAVDGDDDQQRPLSDKWQPGRPELNWDALLEMAALYEDSPTDGAVEARDEWRAQQALYEKAHARRAEIAYYFDYKGKLRTTADGTKKNEREDRGSLVALLPEDGSRPEDKPNFELISEFVSDINEAERTSTYLLIDLAEGRWKSKIRSIRTREHAQTNGLPYLFDFRGQLINVSSGENISTENAFVWSLHKEVPRWDLLKENQAIRVPHRMIDLDSFQRDWELDDRLCREAVRTRYQCFFATDGKLHWAKPGDTRGGEIVAEDSNPLLPNDESTPEDKPDWAVVARVLEFVTHDTHARACGMVQEMLERLETAWLAVSYDADIQARAQEAGWQYYFTKDGTLMNSADGTIAARNEGGYAILNRAGDAPEPNWDHLILAASALPGEGVADSIIRLIDQHMRAWQRRGVVAGDALSGVSFSADGLLLHNGVNPEIHRVRPDPDLRPNWFVDVRLPGSAAILSPGIYGPPNEPNWDALRTEAGLRCFGDAQMRAYELIQAYEVAWQAYRAREQEERAVRDAMLVRPARHTSLPEKQVAADDDCPMCVNNFATEVDAVAVSECCGEKRYCDICFDRILLNTREPEVRGGDRLPAVCPFCNGPFVKKEIFKPVSAEAADGEV